MTYKARWKTGLQVTLSFLLLGLAVRQIDLGDVSTVMGRAQPWYAMGFAGVFYLDRMLMAYKWNVLLLLVGVDVPLMKLFGLYVISPLVGLVLPATIGGDLFRVFGLMRFKGNREAVLASIIVERVIGVLSLFVVASGAFVIASYTIAGMALTIRRVEWLLLSGFGLIVLVTAGAIVLRNVARRVTGNLVVEKVRSVYTLCCGFRHNPGRIFVVTVWTFVEHAVPILANYLMARTLQINVSLIEMVAIIPLIVVVIRLPISFNGFGVQEGLYVVLLGLVGVTASEALLLSVLGRILAIGCALPWGVYFIFSTPHIALSKPEVAAGATCRTTVAD